MKLIWFILAYFRWSDRAVCEASKGMAPTTDFHMRKDAILLSPKWHAPLTCRRCGKEFYA